ncbi:MAG: hypothetical protein NUV51_04125 [Sulfuricaulis sp.]|nr:hypothetical protein [Sulfuricaulis sp.]
MTLAEYLAAWTAHFTTQIAALAQRMDDMSTTILGMTDIEAQAFADLKAQVATAVERIDGAVAALATLTGVVTGHAEQMAALQTSLDAQAARVTAVEAAASIGNLPLPQGITVPEITA